MGNEFKGLESHSAEWFGDSRDYWWNEDYLRFVFDRWAIDAPERVLDVGCGVGHWGRLLARILPKNASLTGIDPDPLWIQKAEQRAASSGLSDRLSYRIGTAEKLPLEDASFDLVTCQTVLMHLGDPEHALREMVRVTRPGGIVLVAEPNNILGPVLFDAVGLDDPIDETVELFRFQLICQRGKKLVGEGDAFIGERLLVLLHAVGLERIEIRTGDRTHFFQPPYATPEERVNVEEFLDLEQRKIWFWKRDQARRYFLAGGGVELDFDPSYERALAQRARTAAAIREERYACAGGVLFYLACARKPAT